MKDMSSITLLREHTATLHQAVEQQPPFSVLMSTKLNEESYLDALFHLYRFIANAEPTLRYHFNVEGTNQYYYYPRLNTIIRDIHHLNGITPASVNCRPDTCLYRAIGIAYVVEGSTNGGQIMAKRLERRLGRSKEEGVGYFNFHRRGTWSLFKKWLNELTLNDEQQSACIAGAKDSFRTLLTESSLSANR